ncbi:MAG: hypothetical protein E7095_01860 [Bacteroides sp.]|nr:hypothetical protein [Bacteroides sp.]
MKERIQKTLILLFCLLVGLLLWGCQQLQDLDEEEAPQLLKVKARAASNEKIAYPLYLYAFDKDGRCAASQVINSAEELPSLTLPAGGYRIVALSDVSGGYVLPEHPEADAPILLESTAGAQTPLMVGKADVTIGSRSSSLNITLRYAVSAISAALNEIPEDVEAVHLLLSPLHASLCMNGEYGSDTHQLDIPCTRDENKVWRTDTVYAFPGSGQETLFSVQLTRKDGNRQTYAYTYRGIPEANRPFNLSGNYTGAISVDGTFIIEGWDTAIDVSFTFGSTQEEEPSDGPTEEEDNDTPQVGRIWKDGIVVETKGNEVLLMSTEEWIATVDEVESILEEEEGWHVPTYEEAQLLKATFGGRELDELNEQIVDYNGTLPEVDGEERYLCDKGGVYYSFIFADGTTISKAGSKRSYYVRLLKNYILN